jgi:hypothetical protein
MTRFLGAPVAVTDMVDILLGDPPARTARGPATVEVTREGEYRLTLPLADGVVQHVWLSADTRAVTRVEEVHDGTVVLAARFGDHEDGFPRTLDVSARGAEARLAYDRVEPNAALDDSLFAPPPANRVLPLDAVVETAVEE